MIILVDITPNYQMTSSSSSRGESSFDSLTAQDYQICVTVIEARHLAGINMDPVVCVQVISSRADHQ